MPSYLIFFSGFSFGFFFLQFLISSDIRKDDFGCALIRILEKDENRNVNFEEFLLTIYTALRFVST